MKFATLRRSLITRLIGYFLLVGLVFTIIFSIIVARGLKSHFSEEIRPNIAQYLVYMTEDIGSPPDISRAARLVEQLSFDLYIDGPGTRWHSNQKMLHWLDDDLERAPPPYQRFWIGRRDSHQIVMLKQGDYRFLYTFGRDFGETRRDRRPHMFLLVFGILSLLFWLIRRSLKPVDRLAEGISNIADGDLEQPIGPLPSSEFNRLAEGIDAMAAQIRNMLESKQQLLLAISHELRSPITRARVNLELLPDSDECEALREDLQEMETLVGHILETERLNQRHAPLNRSDFVLGELVEEVIADYFIGAGISTELSEITINADRMRFGLLLKNLLDNALKYSPVNAKPPRVSVTRLDNSIAIEVEDFGSGMAEEELEKITQAFYRVDRARQRTTGGYGLGLYLSWLIVRAHGGEMHFDSKLEQGTRVRVTL